MTIGQDQREKLFRLLAANPEAQSIVTRALELEDEGRQKPYFLGWAWHEIPVPTQKLKVLVEEGIVKVAYQSRSATDYRLADPELTREALAAVGSSPSQEGIPPDLFDHIVGHDEVKYWLTKSLGGELPVHFLFVGPPATAKTMFMEAVASLPWAHYALGGSTSRAGIADFLLNFRPRFLIIDELDKMDRQDLSVLLSLMQTGLVARLKKGMRETERMAVWVLAGCNAPDRLPPELLSRFLEFQFLEVAVALITHQLGKDPDLAQYITVAPGATCRSWTSSGGLPIPRDPGCRMATLPMLCPFSGPERTIPAVTAGLLANWTGRRTRPCPGPPRGGYLPRYRGREPDGWGTRKAPRVAGPGGAQIDPVLVGNLDSPGHGSQLQGEYRGGLGPRGSSEAIREPAGGQGS